MNINLILYKVELNFNFNFSSVHVQRVSSKKYVYVFNLFEKRTNKTKNNVYGIKSNDKKKTQITFFCLLN